MSVYYCPVCAEVRDADYTFPVECGDELVCRDCYDPTPYCHICGAMEKEKCKCGPIAEND